MRNEVSYTYHADDFLKKQQDAMICGIVKLTMVYALVKTSFEAFVGPLITKFRKAHE